MRRPEYLSILVCLLLLVGCDDIVGSGSVATTPTSQTSGFASWSELLATANARAMTLDPDPVLQYVVADFESCQPDDTSPAYINFHYDKAAGGAMLVTVTDSRPASVWLADADYGGGAPLSAEEREAFRQKTSGVKVSPREACLRVASDGLQFFAGPRVSAFISVYQGSPAPRVWTVSYGEVGSDRELLAWVSVEDGAILKHEWLETAEPASGTPSVQAQ